MTVDAQSENLRRQFTPPEQWSKPAVTDVQAIAQHLANLQSNVLQLARHVMELGVDMNQATERLDAAAREFALLQKRLEKLEGG